VGDKGLEPLATLSNSAEKWAIDEVGGAKSGAIDLELQLVIDAWSSLTAEQRRAVLLVVWSSTRSGKAGVAAGRRLAAPAACLEKGA